MPLPQVAPLLRPKWNRQAASAISEFANRWRSSRSSSSSSSSSSKGDVFESRILFAVTVAAPAGVVLGLCVPLGQEEVKQPMPRSPTTPFARKYGPAPAEPPRTTLTQSALFPAALTQSALNPASVYFPSLYPAQVPQSPTVLQAPTDAGRVFYLCREARRLVNAADDSSGSSGSSDSSGSNNGGDDGDDGDRSGDRSDDGDCQEDRLEAALAAALQCSAAACAYCACK